MAILPDLSSLSREQLEQMVAALAAKPATRVTLKVSEKGAVCLYGLGRFPVTLYASQWALRSRRHQGFHHGQRLPAGSQGLASQSRTPILSASG